MVTREELGIVCISAEVAEIRLGLSSGGGGSGQGLCSVCAVSVQCSIQSCE